MAVCTLFVQRGICIALSQSVYCAYGVAKAKQDITITLKWNRDGHIFIQV